MGRPAELAVSWTAVGVPGMQEVLLEPRNNPVQVLSGRPPGKAAHRGREKRLAVPML